MKTEAAAENVENVEDEGICKGPAFIKICQKMKNRPRTLVNISPHRLTIYIL